MKCVENEKEKRERFSKIVSQTNHKIDVWMACSNSCREKFMRANSRR